MADLESQPITTKSLLEDLGVFGQSETWNMLKTGSPVVLSYLLQMSGGMINCIFLSTLSKVDMAGGALGNMFCTITGLSIGFGLCTAMDTLCSQAFTMSKAGDDQKKTLDGHGNEEQDSTNTILSILLQRGILIMAVLSLFVGAIWLNAENILLAFGQDPEVSRLAGKYCYYSLIGLMPIYIFECQKKHAFAQGLMEAPLVVLLFSTPLLILFSWIFVVNPSTSLGFIGSPLGLSLTYFSMPILMLAYIRFRTGNFEATGLHRLSRRAMEDWIPFLKLGIPGIFMLGSEWWAFEAMTLVSGTMGVSPQAAQSVILQTSSVLYMVPLGMSIACGTRVGNLLGAGGMKNMSRARVVSVISIALALAFSVLTVAVFCMPWRTAWTNLLVRKDEMPEVKDIVNKALPIISWLLIADAFTAVSGGVMRGCGMQKLGALLNIGAYYVLGLPIGISLALGTWMGVQGLWLGLAIALTCLASVLLPIVLRLDWVKQAQLAQERFKANQ